MKENIKEAYIKMYPTDIEGHRLNDITFIDLFDALDNYRCVYETIGVYDSLIRERLFLMLSDIMEVDYEYIYNQWLLGN